MNEKLKKSFLRLLCCFFTLSFCSSLNAQLTTAFKADTTRGCAPLVVKFTDLSTGNPTSWFWDLGNGITSTQQNPTTFYFDPGTYNIKLLIKNALGRDSLVKTSYITVHALPNVNFTANNTNGCFPLPVQFTDLSNAASGSITGWEWDFGDGTISTQQNPLHVYNVAGSFSITLKVKNSFGCVKVYTRPAYINIQGGLDANFSFTTSVSCNPPITVNFTNSSTGLGINSYQWSFGDGGTSTAPNPVHVYNSPGAYTIKLVVKNALGCTDSIVKVNAVQVGSVAANFTFPDTICEGASVLFTNTSAPAPGSSRWFFSDSTTATTVNAQKTFSAPGTYSVKLISNVGACIDSITKSIVVRPKPLADFTFSQPTSACISPFNVSFSSLGSGIANYAWSFGDGFGSNTANPVHQYDVPGTYSVSLAVRGANGCSDSIFKANIIYYGPPKINNIIGAPYRGCAPFSGTFSANVTSIEPVTSFFWDFGDGTTSTTAVPNHTYNSAGAYDISLIIATASGCRDTFKLSAAVVLYAKPTATFTANPLNACANQLINFFDGSTGTITSWFWQFGDGGTSGEQNPSYHYMDTGFFTIKLIVSNNACYDSITVPRYVYINPPVARFSKEFSCEAPFVRKFKDLSVGATRWKWSFGDGSTSTIPNPMHTYASTGMFPIRLEVWNNTCYDYVLDTIWIYDPHPDFSFSDTSLCKYVNATFTAINVDTSHLAAYTWNFGDGLAATNNLPFAVHTYTTAGIFSPSLVVTDKLGCMDTVVKQVSIRIYGPTVNFSNPEGTCKNGIINFTDLSQPYFNQPIINWAWDFGDGQMASASVGPSSHIYNTEGIYTVKLKVTDLYGCVDSMVKPQAVLITDPRADFVIGDSFRCTNTPVNFTNISAGLDLSYNWNFGDGTNAFSLHAIHDYTNEGIYAVSLKVTDRFGCTNTKTKTGITIGNPKAAFSLSDSLGTCPPFLVHFTNASANSSQILWDFGDGSFSNNDSASHYYTVPQTYPVKLIAFGNGNCSDTLTKSIILRGPSGSISYNPLQFCAPGTGNFTARTRNNASFIWDFGDGNTQVTSDSVLSHTYLLPGKYRPKLLLVDSAGCRVPITGSDTVNVAGAVAGIKSFRTNYCDSTSVQFFDSSFVQNDAIVSYQWNFGDGAVSTLKNPNHHYTTTGNYPVSLIVKTAFGCSDSTNGLAPVKITATPRIRIAGDSNICVNQLGSFTASSTVPANTLRWYWRFGNGNSTTEPPPFSQAYSQSGIYFISATATTEAGCTDSTLHRLVVHALPAVNAGADSVICLGQKITLNPTGAVSYLWNQSNSLDCTNCTNPVASPTDTFASYIVTGSSAIGCKKSDTVQVRVIHPMPITALRNDTLCTGQSGGLWVSGADNYTWSPPDGLSATNIANPVANPTSTTTYRVIGKDYKNCFADTAYVPVVVYPIPVVNVVQDKIALPVGSSITLNTVSSPDVTSYKWFPPVNLNCTNCPQPVASPKTDITYRATVTNLGGCTAYDEVTIQMLCNEGNIYLPNTFSPNGDGMNDVFYPRGKGVSIKSIRIFNRWGAIVFQNSNVGLNDASKGWNGTQNGKPLNADVFVYELEVVCENDQIFPLKGNITLIK